MSHKWQNSESSYNDHKDPGHPLYQYKHCEAYQQWVTCMSKDRANLEALEDHVLTPSTAQDILSNTPPEALPLDATTREDTMREDAPLATSHDTSLSPPQSDTTMPRGFD
jgi:hypothetical protein